MSGSDKDDPDQTGPVQPEKPSGYKRKKSSAEKLGRQFKSIGSLGIIPMILAIGPILGLLIGQFLDKKFDTSPWLTILFLIFGFVAAIREMIRLLNQANSDEEKKSKSGKGL